jgi:hypothetical protein
LQSTLVPIFWSTLKQQDIIGIFHIFWKSKQIMPTIQIKGKNYCSFSFSAEVDIIPTWKIVSQAPMEAAAFGTGRRIVTSNFNASDRISTRLFCIPNTSFVITTTQAHH